ncbi:MAG: UDP-2,3-diacylglucosamine diphosphatase, partial [Planctomycetes bacterium]|nr:UDP-2,3-diacylglucosamine diphosphatase [Planctomycetota bacterium]
MTLQGNVHVICDLHLKGASDPQFKHLQTWLEGIPTSHGLWILGDLFEYWLGGASMLDPEHAPVLELLLQRTQNGGAIGLIPGNRDFLVDDEFAIKTGVSIHPEGVSLDGPGGGWLLLHGDELCTLDKGYQRLRRVLRSRPVRFLVRHQPAFLSRALARRLRRASKKSVPSKDPAQMEMQPDEARSRARAAKAQTLLCGHAHRYRD